ncbi:redoxin domain-containing protein [Cupriavidus sp. 30B13]|uniref:redoxin domain-containing protein n=1 Tax=Cupriavidus sp. 30B13 TaxID=3384241 RepID=UPI003B9035BA
MSRVSSVSKCAADHAAEVAMAAAAGAVPGALRAGARVPAFALPDTRGRLVSLDHPLGAGPVVLNFLRGTWCAFGEESLAQLAATHERVVAAGAAAFAIAPPGRLPSTGTSLPVPELVDADMKVARAFGLAFELPAELRRRYLELGYVPPRTRKADSFLVPIPATYLVDQEGVIVLAHIDADYRHHLGNETLLGALRALQARLLARERTARQLAGKWRPGRDR